MKIYPRSGMRTFSLILTSLFCLVWSAGVVAAWEELTSEVDRGMDLWHVPGMAVAVVDSDGIQFQRGFGTTSINDGRPVNEHTLFAIASTTKAMVVAGVLMLVDEGKLTLDDPVIKHIPELHFANSGLDHELNIRDLLAHRTGLPSTDIWTFVQGMELDEQIRRLQLVDQEAPARTRLIYQNTMYELAGIIIERASGQRWDSFLRERLWYPIGMMETFSTRGQIAPEMLHVLPHNYLNEKLLQVQWDIDEDAADAAGSVWSSVHDMSLWAQFLLRGATTEDGQRLVSEKSLADMFEPHQLSNPEDFYPTVELTKPNWRTYGLGWFQQDFQGRMINFHTGSLSGLIAIIGLDRVRDKAIIVLGNRDHAEMRHALLWHVMDESNADMKRDWNQEIFDLYEASRLERLAEREESERSRIPDTKPALPLESYAGTYSNDIIGVFTVRIVNDDLSLETGMLTFEMKHWHLDMFQVVKDDMDSQEFSFFGIDAAGAVATLTVFGAEFLRRDNEQPD